MLRSPALMLALLFAAKGALGYEEQGFARRSDLFFARAGGPSSLSFSSPAEAAKLMAACKSGRTLRVESGPQACRCDAEPLEQGRPEELAVTLRCPRAKRGAADGALALVSDAALTFEDRHLLAFPELARTAARPILEFLKSADEDFRKQGNSRSVRVHAVRAGAAQFWIVHVATETHEEGGCETKQFQIIGRRDGALQLMGQVDDIESIVRLKADGKLLLRTANACDGIQAGLYELAPKLGLSADFSGH